MNYRYRLRLTASAGNIKNTAHRHERNLRK